MKWRPDRSACVLLALCISAPVLAQQPNPDREAYFGETHVHTGWSFPLGSHALRFRHRES